MNARLSREESIAVAAERSRNLMSIVGIGNLARLLAVRPSAVYRWMAYKGAPNAESGERLRVLHECVTVITDELDDPQAALDWLYNRPMGSSLSAAREFTTFYPARDRDRVLIRHAREYVRMRRTGPGPGKGKLTGDDLALKNDEQRALARDFLGLVSSSVKAGVLGDRSRDRVYLRPAESVEHASRVAVVRGQHFNGDTSSVGRGLALLGAATAAGKSSVVRRVAGEVVRVWDIPADLL